jgi:hypothetical protein
LAFVVTPVIAKLFGVLLSVYVISEKNSGS